MRSIGAERFRPSLEPWGLVLSPTLGVGASERDSSELAPRKSFGPIAALSSPLGSSAATAALEAGLAVADDSLHPAMGASWASAYLLIRLDEAVVAEATVRVAEPPGSGLLPVAQHR